MDNFNCMYKGYCYTFEGYMAIVEQLLTEAKAERYRKALECLAQLEYLSLEEACELHRGYRLEHKHAVAYTRWYEQQEEKAHAKAA